MKKLLYIFLLLFFATILTDCCSVGPKIFLRNVKKNIIIGKTTKAEIIKKYGKPKTIGLKDGNVVFHYMHIKANFFVPFVPIRDFAVITITFDKNGKVLSYEASKNYQGIESDFLK